MAIKEYTLKPWKDETAGVSKIEGLVFPADRHWLQCKVTMNGQHKMQKISTEVHTAERKASDSVSGENTKEYTCDINEMTSISIRGELANKGNITGAMGKVTAICTYDDNGEILKSEKDSWDDRTGGNSFIYDLYLPATHKWEKCSIDITFSSNSTTGCMVTLLKNGELSYLPNNTLPGWAESTGSGTITHTFDINDQVPLVVVGYISNKGIGGGAAIKLTGYYRG